MSKEIVASAPGKLILSGEHAVVYGYPALLTAVNKRLQVSISPSGKIKISSDIPTGCGMGSSAAYAVALTAAKLKYRGKSQTKAQINELAYDVEKKHHGNPSGADNSVSTYGGFLWYRKESEKLRIFQPVIPVKTLSNLSIINTGTPSESTKEMVEIVAKKFKNFPGKITAIFKEMEQITRLWLRHLTGESNENILQIIRENERLLEKLGVVSQTTKELIRSIEKRGGAAKICGAGGIKTNSGILLVAGTDKLDQKFKLKLGEVGLRYE